MKIIDTITRWIGSPIAITLSIISVLMYFLFGIIFGFGEAYQLVWMQFFTIITYVFLFVIQYSTNKLSEAQDIKLNELILKIKEADNSLVDIDELTDDQLRVLKEKYKLKAKQNNRNGADT